MRQQARIPVTSNTGLQFMPYRGCKFQLSMEPVILAALQQFTGPRLIDGQYRRGLSYARDVGARHGRRTSLREVECARGPR